jgi:hypothetical protein
MLEYMNEIEKASHLKTSHIINNSNLGEETTPETILASFDIIKDLSEKSKVPVSYVSVNKELETTDDYYLLKMNKYKYKIKTIQLYTKKYF